LKKAPYIVGLTGGIGSGKSTVATCFRNLGIVTVDADQASRAVVEVGTPALSRIADHFGDAVIAEDGRLHRSHLRSIIFQDSGAKAWLENLLHPLIKTWIVEQLTSAQSPYAILESPLLFETDQHLLVNTALLVDVPVELQLSRAMARDKSDETDIKRIIDSQMKREEKCKRADWIFDNSSDETSIAMRVKELHHQFLKLVDQTRSLEIDKSQGKK
jgi:dephospho-CoA kinase